MTLSRLKTFKPHCTVIAGDLNCKYKWFDGSTEAPSKVLLLFLLLFFLSAKVESSQKWNRTWFFGHFFGPYLYISSAVAETIRVINNATSFGAKKMFRKPSLKLLK